MPDADPADTDSAAATTPDSPDSPDTIMVIRHGEKPRSSTEHGFKASGKHDPEALTLRGWQRAGALATLFDPPGELRPGLKRPDRIFATKKEPDGQHLRERQTVRPLAEKLGLQVDHHHRVHKLGELATEVASLSGATLICWEHVVIPTIVTGLGPVEPTPPTAWPHDRFDVVWVFTRTAHGWAFTQVPQLLLAGDSATPIA